MAQDEITGNLVLIGGSAGSLEVIFGLVQKLPATAGAVYVVVIHRKNDADSLLPQLLASRTVMPVREIEDKELMLPNHLYVAPGDYHLLIEDKKSFSLDCSEKWHHSRPSLDVTFESAAQVFGPRVIAVLLSGANADGAVGLRRIKEAGGVTVVQNPATAEVGFMPQQAIRLDAAVRVEDGDAIGDVLRELVQ